MGAPIGNQNGVGHGRPPYNRELMASDLIKWVEEDEDRIEIKEWRIKHKIARHRVIEMCKDSDCFRDAYAYAFDVIALRRHNMNLHDEMKDNLYNQHLRVFDKDLDAMKKDVVEHFESLKQKTNQTEVDRLNALRDFNAEYYKTNPRISCPPESS